MVHHGKASASALTSGYHFAWVIGTGLLLAAIAIAATMLRSAPAVAEVEELPELEARGPEVAYSEAA